MHKSFEFPSQLIFQSQNMIVDRRATLIHDKAHFAPQEILTINEDARQDEQLQKNLRAYHPRDIL